MQNSQIYLDQGYHFYNQGRYEEAITAYAKAVEINPKSSDAYNNWGFALAAQGRYLEACQKYQTAIDINPNSSQVFYNWGNALRRQMKYEEAIQKYKQATIINPGHSLSFNNWGVVLDTQGRFEEAISKYSQAIDVNPNYSQAYNNWGFALDALGRYEEAIFKYIKAIEIDPNYSDAYDNWGNALAALGRYGEAVVQYGKAISINPSHSEAYYNWGLSLYYQNRYEDAVVKYNKAIEINPEYMLARYAVALALYHQGKYADAMFVKIQALKMMQSPQDDESLVNLVEAEIGRAEKKLSKARTEQQKLNLSEKVTNMRKILELFVSPPKKPTPLNTNFNGNSSLKEDVKLSPPKNQEEEIEKQSGSPTTTSTSQRLSSSPTTTQTQTKVLSRSLEPGAPLFPDQKGSDYSKFLTEELNAFFRRVFISKDNKLEEKYENLLPILGFFTALVLPLEKVSYAPKIFPMVSKMAPEGIRLEDLLQIKKFNKICAQFKGLFASWNEISEIIERLVQDLAAFRKDSLVAQNNNKDIFQFRHADKMKKAQEKGFVSQSVVRNPSEETAFFDFNVIVLICFLEGLKVPNWNNYNQKVTNISQKIAEKMKIYIEGQRRNEELFL